jgi:hypothetical protein
MLAVQRRSVGVDIKCMDIVWRLIEKVARFVQGYIRRNKDGDWK